MGCAKKTFGLAVSNNTTNVLTNVSVVWSGGAASFGVLGYDPRFAVTATVYPLRGNLPTNIVISYRLPDGSLVKNEVKVPLTLAEKLQQSQEDLIMVINTGGKVSIGDRQER
jgi:hypothetical protein